MIKHYCDQCTIELEAIDEYTTKQSVKIAMRITSGRRDYSTKDCEFCSQKCAINWLQKAKLPK